MLAPLNMNSQPIRSVAPGTNATDAATFGQLNAVGVPIGTVIDFAGSAIPLGYVFCDGAALSRAGYPQLFAAIGTAWGVGDGSTTFNVPDLRGRVTAGLDNMGGTAANRLTANMVLPNGNTLGAVGGNQTHVLTVGEMPQHSHGVSDPGHTHSYQALIPGSGVDSGNFRAGGSAATGSATTGITIQNNGGNFPHPNVQPTAMLFKLIKALNL
jgi:microcystin-dependent protein